MDSLLKNLDTLDTYTQELVTHFCTTCSTLNGTNVIGIALYGSVNTAEYIPKKSNVNILIVLNDLSYHVLRNNASLVDKFRKKNIVPLFLTETHIRTSSDVFPMEFLEIQENCRVVYGVNVFERDGIVIRRDNLRLECEQQLKGHLIRMHQLLMESGTRRKVLERLLLYSMSTIIPILRACIRVAGGVPATNKRDVVAVSIQKFELDDTLMRVYCVREKKYSTEELEQLMEMYLVVLTTLAIKLDGIHV